MLPEDQYETLQILELPKDFAANPKNPAIWETEPKDLTADLNIYYEASGSIPTKINRETIKTLAPIGSTISSSTIFASDIIVDDYVFNRLIISRPKDSNWLGLMTDDGAGNITFPITAQIEDYILEEDNLIITRPDKTTVSTIVKKLHNIDGSGHTTEIELESDMSSTSVTLNWHNCFSFGNGVESNRIKDTYNQSFIGNGASVSGVLEQAYKEEHRKYGLIYSGVYNSNSGINNLNQFNQSQKITKDINPIYGSIQKLHSRDSDLVVLCEDKCLRILAQKDALYNADGNPQLIASTNVLGQTVPFSGEYGISKDPESFASESYRVYFTDKSRGAVLRLSKDGLTPISDHGMKDWFKDNLKLSTKLIGSYDSRKDEYNITLKVNDVDQPKTVSFTEAVTGWTSFKSFAPENGNSMDSDYYTFNNGKPYKHHVEGTTQNPNPRNTFYGAFANSSFDVVLNQSPSVIKSFNTLNYEGSQSKVDLPRKKSGAIKRDGNYYNLTEKDGWYVESIQTDQEKGSLNEFIEKEGKWFNYIKGLEISTNTLNQITSYDNLDLNSFAIQGVGRISSWEHIVTAGCTDPSASNYNFNCAGNAVIASVDDGCCAEIIYGCMDEAAPNYNPAATVDGVPSSCIYVGCTCDGGAGTGNAPANDCYQDGIAAANYLPFYTMPVYPIVHSSCIQAMMGCTDPNAYNYNPLANTDDGSCVLQVDGCTDPNAYNYSASNNVEDGSCQYLGCMDYNADNGYWPWSLAHDSWSSYQNVMNIGNTQAFIDAGCSSSNPPGPCDVCWDGLPFALPTTPVGMLPTGNLGAGWEFITWWSSGTSQLPCPNLVDPVANNQSVVCTYLGCDDTNSCNYDPTATVDGDYSKCLYCNTSTAMNYSPNAPCDTYCEYCTEPTNITLVSQTDPIIPAGTGTITISFDIPGADLNHIWKIDIEVKDAAGYNAAYERLVNVNMDGITPPYDTVMFANTYSAGTPVYFDPATSGNTFQVTIDEDDIVNMGMPAGSVNTVSVVVSCATQYAYYTYAPANTWNYTSNYFTAGCPTGCPVSPQLTNITIGPDPAIVDGCYDDGVLTHTYAIDGGDLWTDPVMWTVPRPMSFAGPAYNYDPTANRLPIWGSSTFRYILSVDPWMTTTSYTAAGDKWQGCCYFSGCMDFDGYCTVDRCGYDSPYPGIGASNYLSTAQCDGPIWGDSSCSYVVGGVVGCTDITACNFDPTAAIDDGSCILPDGCTDPTYCNYDATAVCDDGSCAGYYGCTDSTQFNYDPSAQCDDGSCIAIVYGCTDATQYNYDPSANVDDGSCVGTAQCMDPFSTNYNVGATVDDGSCFGGLQIGDKISRTLDANGNRFKVTGTSASAMGGHVVIDLTADSNGNMTKGMIVISHGPESNTRPGFVDHTGGGSYYGSYGGVTANTSATWTDPVGCADTYIDLTATAATTYPGAGQYCSNQIMATCASDTAVNNAAWKANVTTDGFSWFLPSTVEWDIARTNGFLPYTICSGPLCYVGGPFYQSGNAWTSTQGSESTNTSGTYPFAEGNYYDDGIVNTSELPPAFNPPWTNAPQGLDASQDDSGSFPPDIPKNWGIYGANQTYFNGYRGVTAFAHFDESP